MSSGHDPLPNWLGALAVAAFDAQNAAMDCERRSSDVAAILTLRQRDSLTIGELRDALGLSQSASVRVVDRLCAERLAVRHATSGVDGRQVGVSLTDAGVAEAERVQHLRLEALDGVLQPLSVGDRELFRDLLERLFRARSRSRPEARQTCRYCDHNRCAGSSCPIGSTVSSVDGPDQRRTS